MIVKTFHNHSATLLVFINWKITHSFTQDLRLSTIFCAQTVLSFSIGNSFTIWLFQNVDSQEKRYNTLAKYYLEPIPATLRFLSLSQRSAKFLIPCYLCWNNELNYPFFISLVHQQDLIIFSKDELVFKAKIPSKCLCQP